MPDDADDSDVAVGRGGPLLAAAAALADMLPLAKSFAMQTEQHCPARLQQGCSKADLNLTLENEVLRTMIQRKKALKVSAKKEECGLCGNTKNSTNWMECSFCQQ